MAVGLVFDGVGVTRAQYEQVHHQVWPDGSLAPGLVRHVAGTTEDGNVVVEVWESQAAGIAIQPRVFDIFNEITS